MAVTVATDRAVYVPWFEALEEKLKWWNLHFGFKTEAGGERRDVVADEFMYMCHDPDPLIVHFKHRDTRNYVYLQQYRGAWLLTVPVTDRPFQRGFF